MAHQPGCSFAATLAKGKSDSCRAWRSLLTTVRIRNGLRGYSTYWIRSTQKATFFPIASRAAAQPGLVARMVGADHAIGLHCHEHVRHSVRDRAWLEADTEEALRLLAKVGLRPSLWRAPWGDTTEFSVQVASENGLRIVHWTLDTHTIGAATAPRRAQRHSGGHLGWRDRPRSRWHRAWRNAQRYR